MPIPGADIDNLIYQEIYKKVSAGEPEDLEKAIKVEAESRGMKGKDVKAAVDYAKKQVS